ncbi:MAG: hypothetical protein QM765_01905 [Myxococcales bacterium]
MSEAPFFKLSGTQDAGKFLNPKLPWQSGSGSLRPVLAKLPFYGPWTCVMKGCASRPPAVDTTWMNQLGGFGSWDLTDSGPLAKGPLDDFPDLMLIQKLCWIRMLVGLEARAPADAAREVRQLAMLFLATEDRSGAYYAAHILKVEEEAFRTFSASGADVSGWSPIDKDQIERLDRLASAMEYLSLPATPVDVLEAAFADKPELVLRCAGISASAERAASVRHFGESEFAPFLQWVDARVSSPGTCRGTAASHYIGAYARPVRERSLTPWMNDPIVSAICKVLRGHCRKVAQLAQAAPGNDTGLDLLLLSKASPHGP